MHQGSARHAHKGGGGVVSAGWARRSAAQQGGARAATTHLLPLVAHIAVGPADPTNRTFTHGVLRQRRLLVALPAKEVMSATVAAMAGPASGWRPPPVERVIALGEGAAGLVDAHIRVRLAMSRQR
eukprot:1086305-Prymnesium_polylepis.2